MSIADRIAVMNDGRLVQVGTPKEIYENPKNVFVAGFLGDPSINFLDCEDVSGTWLSPDEVPGDAARVGIRPEDLFLSAGPDQVYGDTAPAVPSDPTAAELELVEPLGNTYELTLRLAGQQLTARVPSLPEDATVGAELPIRCDLEKLYAFDGDGGRVT